MKKLVIGATLIAAALGSGAILAAQGEHNHGQARQQAGAAGCAMQGEHGRQAHGAQGQERMAQMHARMGERMAQRGEHRGHGDGAKRGEHRGHGNAGADCPMHGERKAS